MAGLTVLLDGCKNASERSPGVISKASMIRTSPVSSPTPSSPNPFSRRRRSSPPSDFAAPAFLDRCFLCKNKLLPVKDIYMYKGDRAFCSVECRCRQISIDEEEEEESLMVKRDNCSLAAMRPQSTGSSPSPPPRPRATRNPPNAFAY